MSEKFFLDTMKSGVSGRFIIHKNVIGETVKNHFRFLMTRPKHLDTLTGFTVTGDIEKGIVLNKSYEADYLEQHHVDWLRIASAGVQVKVEDEEGTFLKLDAGNFKVLKIENGEHFIRFTGFDKKFEGIYKLSQENGETTFQKPENQKLEVEKEKPGINKNLVDWRSKEAIMGTAQVILRDVASIYDLKRKHLVVEYPQRKFIDYLTENYKQSHAIYSQLSEGEDSGFIELAVHGDTLDAFIINLGQRPSLVIFFDDPSEVEKILQLNVAPGDEYTNYRKGAYEIKETMCGYVLIPVNLSANEAPIFDDDVVNSLQQDTEQFFGKREFYKTNNLPHKRGILMYGPPGNGKTTFIRHYMSKNTDKFTILIDSSNIDVGPNIYEFLNKNLGSHPKVLVFEDVDSIASSSWKRSAFLNFLDGINSLDNSLIVGTTNYPQRLDSAILKRPSRFDRIYRIDYPSLEMRKKFLKKWFNYLEEPLLTKYAEKSEGFSGAHFKELFTLKNIQDSSIYEAINSLNRQLNIYSEITAPEKVEKKLRSQVGDFLFHDGDITKSVRNVPIYKAEGTQEEQVVFGEVLIPDDVDAHGDIYTEKSVEEAAHFYMMNFGNIGFMHKFFVNSDVKILETFIAPVNMSLPTTKGGKRKIKKGTWMMKVKVLNADLWAKIKKGELTGFSMGGLASVRELKKAIEKALNDAIGEGLITHDVPKLETIKSLLGGN